MPLLAVAFLLLIFPSSLYAWAREGHEIVAMLAEQRLQPEVRDTIVALLEGTSFIEAASWADKVRNQQTAPWHYVNIAITDTEYDEARVCPQGQCVINQIERFSRVLANPAPTISSVKKTSSISSTLSVTCINRFMPEIITTLVEMMCRWSSSVRRSTPTIVSRGISMPYGIVGFWKHTILTHTTSLSASMLG